MCTEFFLVIIYFFVVLTINYFFFKLLRVYLINIFELIKFKNIFKFFKSSDILMISNLYLNLKSNSFNFLILKRLNILTTIYFSKNNQDIVLLGNLYKFLNKNVKLGLNEYNSGSFYLQLLERQYIK